MEILTYLLHALAHSEHRKRQTEHLKQKQIRALEKKLESARRTCDEPGEAQLLIRLGNVYSAVSDFQLADRAFKQAIDLAHYKSYKTIEMEALVNQGISYKERMEYSNAESSYQDALAIARHTEEWQAEEQIKQLIQELDNMMKIDKLSRQDE